MARLMKKGGGGGGGRKGNRTSGSSLKKSNASTNPGKIVNFYNFTLFSLNLDRVVTGKHMKRDKSTIKRLQMYSQGSKVVRYNNI